MNPLIDLGFISIHWYSVLIFIGILLGSNIVIKEAKRHGFDENTIIDLLFLVVIFGIIGARIYYVLFNLDYYISRPLDIFKIWEGGLAIHGGIISGVICILVLCYKKKINFLKILDYVVVGLILAQGIGRWGNFFNGEAYGAITSLEFLQSLYLPDFIIDGMYINGNYYIPTFFFESVWCFIGFIIMLILRRRGFMKVGYLTSFYLVWYGVERFFVEGMRTDSLMFFSLRVAQLVSLAMVIIGVVLFVYSLKKSKNYEGDENA